MGVANNPEIRQATRCGDIRNGKRQARVEVREIRETSLYKHFRVFLILLFRVLLWNQLLKYDIKSCV
jgi:hypothetical protein